jgi:hypothetical protein
MGKHFCDEEKYIYVPFRKYQIASILETTTVLTHSKPMCVCVERDLKAVSKVIGREGEQGICTPARDF